MYPDLIYGVTDDNMERLMPLEEEFCFVAFPRGEDVPLSRILKEAPGFVWKLEEQGESVAGSLCLLYSRMSFRRDVL